ncbi:MAG: hypothetical protein HWE08_06610 [Alphaproteobacteria bacterium]|nr:hypothetical protein [Alphaproteobacteria bacterium]
MTSDHPYKKSLSIKARLAALLALVFLSAQFLTAAHAATYGKTDHLHNGHPCIVASIVKKSTDLDVDTASAVELEAVPAWLEALPLPVAIAKPTPKAGQIRAPPHHV